MEIQGNCDHKFKEVKDLFESNVEIDVAVIATPNLSLIHI